MGIELQAAAIAFCVALPLTFALRLRTKVGRKGELMPRIGGLSILAGFVVAILVMALFSDEASRFLADEAPFLPSLSAVRSSAPSASDYFKDLDWRLQVSIPSCGALGIYLPLPRSAIDSPRRCTVGLGSLIGVSLLDCF